MYSQHLNEIKINEIKINEIKMPKFSYDIGYYGKVKIAGKGILATGGSISVQYSPIFTTGVWGAYWGNVTDKIAYAPNYVTLSGSINYQLTVPFSEILSDFAFQNRNVSKSCLILPNGVAGYQGEMWCTGCSFSTSQDSLVTGDISLKSGSVSTTSNSLIFGSSDEKTNETSVLSQMCAGYRDVFPYWGTGVFLNSLNDTSERITPKQVGDSYIVRDIIDWNASYSSQLVFSACCNNTQAMLQADYCALGSMQAQGSFTMLKIGSYLNPSNIQKHNTCSIKMKDATGTNKFIIKYGAIVWTSASTDVQTGSSLIQSSFSFNALGNTNRPPMDFVKL